MQYVLGIDGGGTKTECVLLDERGTVVAIGRAGPSNPFRVGLERAIAALREAADAALRHGGVPADRIVALCAGLAGAGDEAIAQQVRVEAAAAFPAMQRNICTDLEIALAATGDGPAILLIAGTGSAAIGRAEDGRTERAGGRGWRSGDQGSANDIGKNAVHAARSHRERNGAESMLGIQLLDELGISDWNQLHPEEVASDLPVTVRDSTRKDALEAYPRLFPVVAKAADAGDLTACAILKDAAQRLGTLVADLVIRLKLEKVPFRLAKTGGMIGRCAYFDAELARLLRQAAPRGVTGELTVTPAHAAARMAWRLVGDASRPQL